jgi:hypothetical protein
LLYMMVRTSGVGKDFFAFVMIIYDWLPNVTLYIFRWKYAQSGVAKWYKGIVLFTFSLQCASNGKQTIVIVDFCLLYKTNYSAFFYSVFLLKFCLEPCPIFVWGPPGLLIAGSCCWVVWGLRSWNGATAFLVDHVYHTLSGVHFFLLSVIILRFQKQLFRFNWYPFLLLQV